MALDLRSKDEESVSALHGKGLERRQGKTENWAQMCIMRLRNEDLASIPTKVEKEI